MDIAKEPCQYGKFKSYKLFFFLLFQKKAFESVPVRIKVVSWPKENYLIWIPEHMIRIYEATSWLSDTLSDLTVKWINV